MPDPQADALKPTNKDPAEGGRDADRGAPPTADPEGSHLGEGGDAVEGDAPPEAAGDPAI